MEPIPETAEAIAEFGPLLLEEDLLAEMERMGACVREFVPECVGLSLARRDHGVTFTLADTVEPMLALDRPQSLDDDPCPPPVDDPGMAELRGRDVLDEETWQLFGRGTA